MVTDVQGVERLRERDAQAFRSLIDRLQQPITGYLHRLVGDRDVALDLAQDTFVQVYKEINKTSRESFPDVLIISIYTLTKVTCAMLITHSSSLTMSSKHSLMY